MKSVYKLDIVRRLSKINKFLVEKQQNPNLKSKTSNLQTKTPCNYLKIEDKALILCVSTSFMPRNHWTQKLPMY